MRPRYETAETLAAERKLADKVEAHWNVRMVKLPFSYEIDFAIDTGPHSAVIGWAEVKCRYCARREHPSYILSVAKWAALRQTQDLTELPSLVVFGWTDDSAGWMRADKIRPPITINGRTDRNDPDDVEPVLWLGASDFAPLTMEPYELAALSGRIFPA